MKTTTNTKTNVNTAVGISLITLVGLTFSSLAFALAVAPLISDEQTIPAGLYDTDNDGYEQLIDCDDNNSSLHPGLTEPTIFDTQDTVASQDYYEYLISECEQNELQALILSDNGGDNKDNDCDGRVDEGTIAYDDDNDGVAEIDGDCNDNDSSIQ